MKKKELKQLKTLSMLLAPEYIKMNVSKGVLGSQLIEQGTNNLSYGTAVKPGNHYVGTVAEQKPVNHYRIMKRLCKNHGIEAAINYFKSKPKRKIKDE